MTIYNEISSIFTPSADDRILCSHKPMNIALVLSAPYNSVLRSKSTGSLGVMIMFIIIIEAIFNTANIPTIIHKALDI